MPMPFSLTSYLLGVGTVVGALTLGFGGGVLLTKTAIKDSPNAPSKIERAARAEPMPAPQQVTEARSIPLPRADAPAAQPTVSPVPQVQAATETKPVAEAAEPAKPAEPVKQAEAPKQEPKQADAPRQMEQQQSERRMSGREQWMADHEQRRAERRIEREQRRAERKARAMASRQRPLLEERPEKPELAFEREEPRPNLFGLFDRPADVAPAERE